DGYPGAAPRALRPADHGAQGARDRAPGRAGGDALAGRPARGADARGDGPVLAGRAAGARPRRAARERARPALPLARPRAPAGGFDRRSCGAARARVANRPLVGRSRLPRGPRPLRALARWRPRADYAARPVERPPGGRLGLRWAS